MKKLCKILLVTMVGVCLCGCNYNVKFTPAENGKGGDIEISENTDDMVNTEMKETLTNEKTEDVSTEESSVTEKTEEESSELPSTESTTNIDTVVDINNYDYVSKTGVAFNCSTQLTAAADTETYTTYVWDKEGLFELTVEDNGGSFTMQEEMDIIKDTYPSSEEVLHVRDEVTSTTSGHDAWVFLVQDNGSQYYTCYMLIDTPSAVKTIKGVFDNEEGFSLFKEITDSLVYVYYN